VSESSDTYYHREGNRMPHKWMRQKEVKNSVTATHMHKNMYYNKPLMAISFYEKFS